MSGKERVLVIDDDVKLCRLIEEYLDSMGYEVESAHTGPDGLDMASSGSFKAVILDVMLPGIDGFEVLKRLRAVSDIPVLMLTSRGDETDRIVGLEIGADDYLPKTFSTRELLARLRAVIRRSCKPVYSEQPRRSILLGTLRIEPDSHEVFLDERLLELSPIECPLVPGHIRR